MFTADDNVGARVVRESYPDGEAGIQKSLQTICAKVREGAPTPLMRSFAGNILRQAKFPRTNKEKATAHFNKVKATVGYTHDPPGTELIQSAAVTLCVEGAPVCIPIEDCFPEGTLLLRKDGQLVPIERIEVGDLIWGHNKWTRIEKKLFKGKLKVDAIEMNNGSTMYLTPDHKLYVGRCKHDKSIDCASCPRPVQRSETFQRIHVSDLQEGETLLQPERIEFGSTSEDPDRMYIEGLVLSEGWVRENGREFSISGQDGKRKEALKHEVKAICDRLGIETRWHRKYITVKDPEWSMKLRRLGERARFKHAASLDLNESTAAALLRGLMSDSTADTGGHGRTYSTTSYKMMVQVRVLQRMFGKRTGVKMLTPEQHQGFGKHPLWRVGVNAHQETTNVSKTLAVRAIERAVKKVSCWDITTEDHYVYMPEHDVTVSNCDGHVTCVATLCAASGLEVAIVRQFFGSEHQQHVICEVKLEDGSWFPLDTTTNRFGPGEKAKATKETRMSPWDGQATGLSDEAEFIGIGALPVLGLGADGRYHTLCSAMVLGPDEPPKAWYDVGQGVQASRPIVKPLPGLEGIREGLEEIGELFPSLPKLTTGEAVAAGGAIVAVSVGIAAIIRKVRQG